MHLSLVLCPLQMCQSQLSGVLEVAVTIVRVAMLAGSGVVQAVAKSAAYPHHPPTACISQSGRQMPLYRGKTSLPTPASIPDRVNGALETRQAPRGASGEMA